MIDTVTLTVTNQGKESSLIVNDSKVIDILNNSDNPLSKLQTLVKNGCLLEFYIPPIIQSCNCCDKLSDIESKMTNLDELFNNGGNSSKNGKLGELFACKVFQKRNPGIEYEDTANKEKHGDGVIRLKNYAIDRIMIDYKYYDSVVPTSEVEKLQRDMDAQGFTFGILYSYKSRISKKKAIDYDIIDNKLIVYISSDGLDILAMELAIQYIQCLYECNVLSHSEQVASLASQQISRDIIQIHENLLNLIQKVTRLINSLRESQSKMNKIFMDLIKEATDISSELNLMTTKSKELVLDNHKAPPSESSSYRDLLEYTRSVIDKKKDIYLTTRLLNYLNEREYNCVISHTDTSIHIRKEGIHKGKIQLSKTRVILQVVNYDTTNCQFNINYEEYRKSNNSYWIQLTDNDECWKVIESRLN